VGLGLTWGWMGKGITSNSRHPIPTRARSA
jgi:hypothetical protein